MTSAWRGDWYERVKERVRERGFDTVTAFVDTQPTTSLLVLADILGKDDVAASQVEWALIDEAEESGTSERCARSLLVRRLHEELPEGWHTEWDDSPMGSAFRRAHAYSSWCTPLPDRYSEAAERVWDVLVAMAIPHGWLPAGPDDPILLDAFKHWNEPA